MKLTIIRLTTLSAQDRIDLSKIWPGCNIDTLRVDDVHQLYAARFNERLLGAVRVTLKDHQAGLDSLCVREVTRRRGVGRYLLEETMRSNPGISRWWMNNTACENHDVMAAFMQALNFSMRQDGWVNEPAISEEDKS